MDFWSRLGEIAQQHDVLEHPFYRRWSAGELSRADLALYSGQYRQAVVALADAAANAAADAQDSAVRAELEAHAGEEAAHVELWDRFLDAVGGERDALATPETAACTRVWAGTEGRDLLGTLAAMYAIESAQPAISATKREGLSAHYGITGAGADYFTLHETLDIEHAASARALLDTLRTPADDERLLAHAQRALEANWTLLDGVTA